jgi:myo-inositol-1-phosphate synthase
MRKSHLLSTIFAVASILEGVPFINGAPQNTFVPGVIELAEQHNSFIGGDDLKAGQTTLRAYWQSSSSMLGSNRSLLRATITSETMMDAILAPSVSSVARRSQRAASLMTWSRLIAYLYKTKAEVEAEQGIVCPRLSTQLHTHVMILGASTGKSVKDVKGEHPDHVVVIKYMPAVGDSKRAINEYYSEIMGGGRSTINIFNECEDSLLATPLILDLTILAELLTRIKSPQPRTARNTI